MALKPSTRAFVEEARRTPGYSLVRDPAKGEPLEIRQLIADAVIAA